MNTLMKACRSLGYRVSEKVEGGSGTFLVVKINKRPDPYIGDTLQGFIYTDSGKLFRSEGVFTTGPMKTKDKVLIPDQDAMVYLGDQDTTELSGLMNALADKTNYKTTNRTMDAIYMSAKSDKLEGRSRRKLQEGAGETKREVMGNWVVYFDTDEAGNVVSISQVQHAKRERTVTISAGTRFGSKMATAEVGWSSAGSDGMTDELVKARIDLMQDAMDTVNALIKKYPDLIRWSGK